ncbi:MAG TPA: rRNA (cytidine-2'-O-)-methyltransferase, partial [Acidimicrobiia bacterium]|nr:rRNA (cytidine-2'-O-)-methyltransferase [Acidimicrobiia bacterium]
MPGRLYLCSTPIGNLGDASSRLIETLAAADVVFVEDTRRSGKLLNALGVSAPLRSFFAGNERQRSGEVAAELEAGRVV